MFRDVFLKKNKEVVKLRTRLAKGQGKLDDAAREVDALASAAREKRVILAQKEEEANLALEEITLSMERAKQKKHEVEELTVQQQEKEDQINAQKQRIDAQLAEVQPLLEAAQHAVGAVSFTVSRVSFRFALSWRSLLARWCVIFGLLHRLTQRIWRISSLCGPPRMLFGTFWKGLSVSYSFSLCCMECLAILLLLLLLLLPCLCVFFFFF